mgnify:CR=1 FL=1
MPDNDLVSSGTYAQLFTLHGTVMMFLFAVPIFEAVAILILPGMLGARDLPTVLTDGQRQADGLDHLKAMQQVDI